MTTVLSGSARPPMPLVVLKALRPRQWIKNFVLFVPLLFAKGIFKDDLGWRSLQAVMVFCLLASGVYLANDWVDREKDRLHPEKRLRPIAAGHLSGAMAAVLVVLLWGGAAAWGWALGKTFFGVCVAYIALQLIYTPLLKKAVILDVMAIAAGFILRIFAGATAISVQVSNWLFLCTLLGAVFLGFAKRRHELSSLEEGAGAHRANLNEYTLPLIDQMMSISAACTILAYGLYTVSKETIDHVGSDMLKFTVPCVVYGVFRYLYLVHKKNLGGSPEKMLLGDLPLLIDSVLFLGLAALALYH
ncbi:MAG: decaprenyl-phosphate phosphoribosyltransferase [Myxococcaceae bacterium]|nr:decaprenyl-phosphate phosphoribosyltransferase [Myxococcaceae bacterium]